MFQLAAKSHNPVKAFEYKLILLLLKRRVCDKLTSDELLLNRRRKFDYAYKKPWNLEISECSLVCSCDDVHTFAQEVKFDWLGLLCRVAVFTFKQEVHILELDYN